MISGEHGEQEIIVIVLNILPKGKGENFILIDDYWKKNRLCIRLIP